MQTSFLNGLKYRATNHLTIFDVLYYFDYSISLLVIEYNSYIFPKNDWKNTIICNDDKIEIVTIVGGG